MTTIETLTQNLTQALEDGERAHDMWIGLADELDAAIAAGAPQATIETLTARTDRAYEEHEQLREARRAAKKALAEATN